MHVRAPGGQGAGPRAWMRPELPVEFLKPRRSRQRACDCTPGCPSQSAALVTLAIRAVRHPPCDIVQRYPMRHGIPCAASPSGTVSHPAQLLRVSHAARSSRLLRRRPQSLRGHGGQPVVREIEPCDLSGRVQRSRATLRPAPAVRWDCCRSVSVLPVHQRWAGGQKGRSCTQGPATDTPHRHTIGYALGAWSARLKLKGSIESVRAFGSIRVR